MNIALIGYGNMGQEIERVLKAQNKHAIVSISSKDNYNILDKEGIKKADVAIDFTAPAVVVQNIQAVLGLGTPLVVGTTGWYDKLPEVKKLVSKYKGGLIYGGNFSIGAQVYFKIIDYASTVFGRFSDYDVYGIEVHHSGKKDSPSGTAKKLAEILLKNMRHKKELQTNRLDRQIKPEELHFASVRGGSNFGYHEVVFDSPADEIKLVHAARSREGFARGAIMAAEFIKKRKGIYRFDDIFDELV